MRSRPCQAADPIRAIQLYHLLRSARTVPRAGGLSEKFGPRLHRPAPLAEEIAAMYAATVWRLVADSVSLRHLRYFVREIRALSRPIAETRLTSAWTECLTCE